MDILTHPCLGFSDKIALYIFTPGGRAAVMLVSLTEKKYFKTNKSRKILISLPNADLFRIEGDNLWKALKNDTKSIFAVSIIHIFFRYLGHASINSNITSAAIAFRIAAESNLLVFDFKNRQRKTQWH